MSNEGSEPTNAGFASEPPTLAMRAVTPIGHEIDVWFEEKVKAIEGLTPDLLNALHAAKDDLKDRLEPRFEEKKPTDAE